VVTKERSPSLYGMHFAIIVYQVSGLALAIIPMSGIAYYNLTRSRDTGAKLAKKNLVGLSHGTAYPIEQLLTENQRTSATLAGEQLVAQFMASLKRMRSVAWVSVGLVTVIVFIMSILLEHGIIRPPSPEGCGRSCGTRSIFRAIGYRGGNNGP